jgi:transcriptional regulator with XRE-family HTH domain
VDNNQTQLNAGNQREIPILSASRVPALVPMDLIVKCRTRLDAIRLCVQLSGYSQETIAEQLKIDKGGFSRMMQGRSNFPDTKSLDLMYLCGNCAPTQFENWKLGLRVERENVAQKLAEARAEVERLERINGMHQHATNINMAIAA